MFQNYPSYNPGCNTAASINQPATTTWLRRCYDWVLQSANTTKALWVLLIIAFAESSVFPMPPDLLLIPMVLANRGQAWRLAGFCTVASVLGGGVGYAIGYYLYASLGEWVIQTYHLKDAFDRFQQGFQEWGFWIIALKGLTPIPYKLVTIASGVAHFDVKSFMISSLIARSFRFYLLAALLWWGGDWAKYYVEKYLGLFLTISLGIIVIGFFMFKFL